MSKYRIRLNDKDLEVTLLSRDGGTLKFEVGAEAYSAEIVERLDSSGPIAKVTNIEIFTHEAAKPKTSLNGHVTAPMPGVIVKILVSKGQVVKPGDALMTIEAMKMENHIKAPRAGTVKEILAKQGEEVQANQTLLQLS